MGITLGRTYIQHPSDRVWYRNGGPPPLDYNDGDEVENRIAEIVAGASDLSSLSVELASHITDWPSAYHLSPLRANLLRPIQGLFRGSTLDLGAGCGALTRFLGEQGRVVAVEGSPRRARIAASRCRDLPGVMVVCDRIESYETEDRFDAITLIGVLEYAGLYSTGPDPARQLLRRLRGMLADDGALVIAIENQLGLKYFNGAPEDHFLTPMFGINDLYRGASPATYGRAELERMLRDCGFEQIEILLPLPDYKLPNTVVLPEALERDPDAFDLGTILAAAAFADAQQAQAPLFSLEKAWRVVARNGLACDLANSLLIVARPRRVEHPLGRENDGVLVRHYGGIRSKEFARDVTIGERSGELVVSREALSPGAERGSGLTVDWKEEPYIRGVIWTDRLVDILNQPGWTAEQVVEWARAWERLLAAAAHTQAGPPAEWLLPPSYLDATPFNVILEHGGGFRFFDLEWVAEEPVPFGYVLFRGLLWALAKITSVAPPAAGVPTGVLDLAGQVSAGLGYAVTGPFLARYFERENEFRRRATGVRFTATSEELARTHLRVRHALGAYEANREHIRAQDDQITQLIQQVQHLRGVSAELESERRRANRLEEALIRASADRERLTAEMARLRERVSQMVSVEADAVRLRADLELLRDVAAQRDAAVQRVLQAEKALTERAIAVRAVEAERDAQASRAARLARDNEVLRTHAESATARLRQLERFVTALDAQKHAAERRLRETLESKSWRWMAPLRWALDVVRGAGSGIKRVVAELIYLPLLLLRSVAGLSLAARLVAHLRVLDPTFLLRGLVDLHEVSLLFDAQYYSAANPDVGPGGFHPLAHYLAYGAAELRNPHPLFDARFYCASKPGARSNPLVSYLRSGGKEGPDPHPLFDTRYFLERNPGAGLSSLSPLAFFLSLRGDPEVVVHPLFDAGFYRSQGPVPPGMSALLHYVVRGGMERRNPHPLFDTGYYLSQCAGAQAIAVPLAHYLTEGAAAGRQPHMLFDTAHYLRQAEGLDASHALAHYVTAGGWEGLDPNPLLDGRWYIERCPEMRHTGWTPLEHYLLAGAAAGCDPHPLFDTDFYLERHEGVAQSGLNPLAHFLHFGLAEQRQPHPLFDPAYYLAANPDVARAGVPAFLHFLYSGGAEGRDPHPLFDTSFYVERYPDAAASGWNPLVHYLVIGSPEYRNPHPLFDAAFYNHLYQEGCARRGGPLQHYVLEGGPAGCHPCMLFDAPYYIATYFGGDAAGRNPLVHYLLEGANRGLRPNILFDSEYYLRQYPEVAASGMLPLIHYALRGDREGKRPNPLFYPSFYHERNPDVGEAGLTALAHYLWAGAREGRDPHLLFDTSFYLETNPDVAASGMNPLAHFLLCGGAEGRDPSVLFDSKLYLKEHPELAESGGNPLVHYLENAKPAGVATEAAVLPPQIPGLDDNPDRARVSSLERNPLLSILLPVYNTPPQYLRAAIDSVLRQRYAHWELCICDDGSTRGGTRSLLEACLLEDRRIRIEWNDSNGGISRATNRALASARGDYVAMLDHDDLLEPDALLEIARVLNEDPETEAVYTDQDYVTADGRLSRRFYKPDWSPEMFRGVMYVGHLLVVRRSLAVALGGFDPAFDNVQDFEFMLRVAERTPRIRHIPKILYHWRMIPGSVASSGNAKPNIGQLQSRAVSAHLRRMGIPAEAAPHPSLAHRAILRPLPRSTFPQVTVVLTGDAPPDAEARIAASTAYPNIRVTRDRTAALGDFAVFLDGSVQPGPADWIEQLLFYAERPGAGAVAPMILNSAGRVRSAGLVLHSTRGVVPSMEGEDPSGDGYAGSLACSREVSAVSGECLMIAVPTLETLGGWSPLWASALFAGADLSLRARRHGLENYYQARAVAIASAPHAEATLDRLLFVDMYSDVLAAPDPYHNPNFSREGRAFLECDEVLEAAGTLR